MGICSSNSSGAGGKMSAEELEWNRRIEEDLLASAQQELPVIKLLLLGTGASGKSTIFKQITKLYGEGFNINQLNNYKALVRKNVISAMTTLLEHVPKYSNKIKQAGLTQQAKDLPVEKINNIFSIDLENFAKSISDSDQSKTVIDDSQVSLEEKKEDEDDDDDDIMDFGMAKKKGPGGKGNKREDSAKHQSATNIKMTMELGEFMADLWSNPVIQLVFSHADEFQLIDSAQYFLDHIKTVASANYIPSDDDLLRVRAPTTGVIEQKFQIDSREFCMFDVGGQRNERRKWIHCFENVTAVLFICGISEYNQVLYEDATTNRLDESLSLFGEIANNRFLGKTSLILFLNKKDLFQTKLEKHPLVETFPAYTGPNEYEPALEWIKGQFQKKIKSLNAATDARRKLYVHVTCATDTNNIKLVFENVKDIIIKQNSAPSLS